MTEKEQQPQEARQDRKELIGTHSGNNGNKSFSKVNSLDIPEIAKKIRSGKFHLHESKSVPERSLLLWKKRGYNSHRIGVYHVRYPENIKKKYVFPLWFWVVR